LLVVVVVSYVKDEYATPIVKYVANVPLVFIVVVRAHLIMPYLHDANNSPNTPEPQAVSPNRKPQYNERNCGYRCGEGCEEPSDEADSGGGSDSDTAVGSISASDRIRMSPVLYEDVDGMGTSRLGSPMSEQIEDGPLVASEPREDYDEQVEISSNENFSGTYSRATSGSRSAGTLSPMSPGPGMGAWALVEYYFLVTPLRLSPQYEHCRGHQSSHLVARDDQSSMDLV
jgi:hypothetical protein